MAVLCGNYHLPPKVNIILSLQVEVKNWLSLYFYCLPSSPSCWYATCPLNIIPWALVTGAISFVCNQWITRISPSSEDHQRRNSTGRNRATRFQKTVGNKSSKTGTRQHNRAALRAGRPCPGGHGASPAPGAGTPKTRAWNAKAARDQPCARI